MLQRTQLFATQQDLKAAQHSTFCYVKSCCADRGCLIVQMSCIAQGLVNRNTAQHKQSKLSLVVQQHVMITFICAAINADHCCLRFLSLSPARSAKHAADCQARCSCGCSLTTNSAWLSSPSLCSMPRALFPHKPGRSTCRLGDAAVYTVAASA